MKYPDMEDANWALIPDYMQKSVRAYIMEGRPVGNFLTAFLSNDLRMTFTRADVTNQLRIRDYISFFYNYVPSDCWGSPEKVKAWIQKHKENHGST